MAVHASSCAVLAGVRNAYALLPELMPRVFFLWVHAFSAAIVLGTIVIRAPSSALVESSLKELDIACELFERAKEGCRPGRALVGFFSFFFFFCDFGFIYTTILFPLFFFLGASFEAP